MTFISFFRSLGFFFVFFIGACGQNTDDLSVVTVVTGLEHPSRLTNLMAGMIQQSKISVPATACAQTNLLAGVKLGPDDLEIRTIPVSMITPFTAPEGTLISQTNPSLWITNRAPFDPIQFKVPAGLVEFGVIGTIIDPTGSTGGATCDEFGGSGTVAVANLSISGHMKTSISGDTQLPLNVLGSESNDHAISEHFIGLYFFKWR